MHSITESSMVNEALVDHRSSELNGSPVDQPLVEPAGATKSIKGWLVKTLMALTLLFAGAVFGLYKMRVDIPALYTPKIYAHLDSLSERIVSRYQSYFHKQEGEEAHQEEHQITVTSPMAKDVIITQQYVCQIHSRRHIDVCALEDGYLEEVTIKEGQAVKAGDVLFQIRPVLYQAKWEAKVAEKDLAQLELDYTKTLADKKGVSQKEVQLYKAKLARAKAEAEQAKAEFDFTKVTARFDGIIDRLHVFQGSLVREGDILTTLSDNKVMWVYFNVPEKAYLEYKAHLAAHQQDDKVELELANHDKFPHPCDNLVITAQFNNQNGNIAFRGDFKNPDGLLRHGQTGTILIHRTLKNSIIIPQRATFELLDKRYVWALDEDGKAKQTLITIKHELDDIFVIDKGIDVNDKIVLEGVRQVEEGSKVEYEFVKPEVALKDLKFRAE
jgi:membrane fusion protein, multidrug efflux system